MCGKDDDSSESDSADDNNDDDSRTLHSPPRRFPKRLSIDHEEKDEDPFRSLKREKWLRRRRKGRTIYFSRHGESEYNVDNRIGGDPNLTNKGRVYAKAFGNYINALHLPDLAVWTSKLRRTVQTAAHIRSTPRETPLLNEIDTGTLDGLTYDEFRDLYPAEWAARDRDKFRYRYPKGESYFDLCRRVKPVCEAMETKTCNLVVVAHQALLRCIFGYLMDKPLDAVPYIKIPQHTIMEVTLSECGENVVTYIRMPVEHAEQGVGQDEDKNEK